MHILRSHDRQKLEQLLQVFPCVAILGARQTGKTTLARQFNAAHHFDLENPRDLARLDNPQLALETLKGLIVIDEIQRSPELFPLLRYLVDNQAGQQYLILGSASRDLIQQSSETLAGRIGYHQLGGLGLQDVGAAELRKLWVRGGLPRSFLAENDAASCLWRDNYITTFLERDIPALGISIPAHALRRFWTMISHYHGQTLNYSELARSFGVSDTTVRRYLDILEGTFMVRLLQPWHVNLGKRLVKSPKLYIRDSGLFHRLVMLDTEADIMGHPKLGASWEGFALEALARHLGRSNHELHFWATHAGAEVDLLWQQGGETWAAEFKFADAPRMTKSMQHAVQDLDLKRLLVICPSGESYALSEKVTVHSLADALREIS